MVKENTFGKKNWRITGLLWGFFMYLIMEIAYPYAIDEPYKTKKMLIGVVVWGLGGLIYGYVMHNYFNSRRKK